MAPGLNLKGHVGTRSLCLDHFSSFGEWTVVLKIVDLLFGGKLPPELISKTYNEGEELTAEGSPLSSICNLQNACTHMLLIIK